MTTSQNSVFVGCVNETDRVLVVQSKKGEMWGMPGGPVTSNSCGFILPSARSWMRKLFSVKADVDLLEDVSAWWKQSKQESYSLVQVNTDTYHISIADGMQNRYICDYAWWTEADISSHLYESKDMPWGQAKMALWTLFPQLLVESLGPQMGNPLTENMGMFQGHNWVCPE